MSPVFPFSGRLSKVTPYEVTQFWDVSQLNLKWTKERAYGTLDLYEYL